MKTEFDLALAEEKVPKHHVSVEKGDILHLHGETYRILGSVSLGMPVREVTFHLAPLSERAEKIAALAQAEQKS